MKLFRPVGLLELALVFDSEMRAFPPRLLEQPIFYPVLNEDYAVQIARDWNAPDSKSGFAGYVTEFDIEPGYASRFPKKIVGSSIHEELWVPAEELTEFNRHIIGHIRVKRAFFGSSFTGFVPPQFGLKGKNARDQFTCLVGTFGYSGMDFLCELAANKKTVFLNFPFWLQTDFSAQGILAEEKAKVLSAIQKVWNERSPQTPLCDSRNRMPLS
jgi:hypothetical protein